MKKKGLIIGIVGVVLIAAAVVTIMLLPKKSAKEIYTEAVKNSLSFSSLEKLNDEIDYETILKNHIIKISLDSDGSSVDEENGSRTFTEKLLMYVGKDNFYLTGNSIVNSKTLEFEAALKDNKVYMLFKDIFKKYYYADMSETNTSERVDLNIEKLLTLFRDSFLDVIENDKVKKESTDITIDGKNYKVDKYAHTFTGDHLYKVVKDFINKVKNDKELNSQLSSLLKNATVDGKSISLNDALDIVLQQAEPLKQFGDLFTYTLYLDGDEIISKVAAINIEFGEQSIPVSLTINSVKSFEEVYVSMMGQKMYEFTIKETSENNADISIKMLGQEIASGKIVKTDNSLTVTINGNESVGVKFKFEAKINKVSEYQVEGIITLESENSHASYRIKTEEVNEMPSFDISNSAPIEEITAEEKEALKAVLGEMYPGVNLSFAGDNTISG